MYVHTYEYLARVLTRLIACLDSFWMQFFFGACILRLKSTNLNFIIVCLPDSHTSWLTTRVAFFLAFCNRCLVSFQELQSVAWSSLARSLPDPSELFETCTLQIRRKVVRRSSSFAQRFFFTSVLNFSWQNVTKVNDPANQSARQWCTALHCLPFTWANQACLHRDDWKIKKMPYFPVFLYKKN